PYPTGEDGASTAIEILAMAPAVLAEGHHQGEGFRYYIEDSDLNGIVKIMTGNTDPASIAKFRYGSGMLVHMSRGKGEVVTAATWEALRKPGLTIASTRRGSRCEGSP